jgi:tetrapyrrole methylase family protein/MazG family protein
MTNKTPESVTPRIIDRERAMRILSEVVETVHALRAPGGCPWDRAQTHQTLRPFVIEEAYEVLDVLDQISNTEQLKDPVIRANFREELGDLLMQVLLHSEMTAEVEAFDFFDVASGLTEKLVRRHPHVFGGEKASDADAALKSWEARKLEEKKKIAQASSVLDGMPKGLPALQKTARIIDKVTKVGFQWPTIDGPLEQLRSELAEFEAEARQVDSCTHPEDKQKLVERMHDELGDLLFSVCNVGHFFKIAPEDALRRTLIKFERRFRFVEDRLREKGSAPERSTLEEMDQYWKEAKTHEVK